MSDYLNQKIMSFPRLQVVLNEANKNSQAFIKARLVELLSTVNIDSLKTSTILVDALTEDCDLIFESSINEDIPNETIKCTMLFSGIE